MPPTSKLIESLATQPHHVMVDVLGWVADFDAIDKAGNKSRAVANISARRCVSPATVNRKYYAYQKNGASALVDGRSHKKPVTSLTGPQSPQFVQFVSDLFFKFQRNHGAAAEVHRCLIDRWKLWQRDPQNEAYRIPGYDKPPKAGAKSRYQYPDGWSRRRICDLAPDKLNAALARQGRLAANTLLPSVLTTRVGLAVGSAYMFDDQWYDVYVQSGNQIVRPLGINAIDLFSGCDFARGFIPRLRKEDSTGTMGLKESDMLWLVIHVLTEYGFRNDANGTRLVVERGTATVREWFARMVTDATDGKVLISRGGISTEVTRGVLPPAKGNPRFKAFREGWFSVLRTQMAMLPGATGMNRDSKPEDGERLIALSNRWLKLAGGDEELIHSLTLPQLPWSRFIQLAGLITEGINLRTDHALEGWPELGYQTVEYRVGEEWVNEGEYRGLPPETRGLIIARMEQGEIVSRERNLSPREVFDGGVTGLKKVSVWQWHQLIPREYALQRKIPDNRTLVIKDSELAPEAIIFQPTYLDREGQQLPLRPGETVIVYLNPFRLDLALICTEQGKPFGLVLQVQKAKRFDEAELAKQYAQRAIVKAYAEVPAREHNKRAGDALREMIDHNNSVLGIEQKNKPKKRAKKSKETGPTDLSLLTQQQEPDEDDFDGNLTLF